MAETNPTAKRASWIGWAVLVAVLVAALYPLRAELGAAFANVAPHAPDWTLWIALPLTIKLHILAALTALGVGTVILFKPKGTGFHKTLGWTWVIAMATTAVSSLFITGLNGNFYSFIHLLSGWTIIGLPMAIFAIRNRKVDAHKRAMTGMFVGGLLIAGVLTFLPGRFMFEFLLG
ncbi:DUF2306 domain-containing protein [Terricaulis silvestris]|uniref:DUF2306 domain-containing protein n=1 Tax=Terricaulis silvestris TaxID=2686094 RepID=A0A6I6MS15_9CAUL|nr:DUF2306 domain-containing protein [Terricaulis silvestris]QGZ96941.1 hypothetical protein DSM104635_03806 [Terricaulis silvestris]